MPLESFQLGSTGPNVCRLGLGGCPLGGHGSGRSDDRLAERAVDEAAELGVNFFDTADCYGLGHSERLLSKALGARRRHVVIASKFGVRVSADGKAHLDNSPRYLREALEASLRRLRLDRIPLYYVHWPDGKTPLEEVLEELLHQQRLGKIEHIGLSNFDRSDLTHAHSIAPIAATQAQYSLVDVRQATAARVTSSTTSTSFLAWGCLSQGLLTGKYQADARFGSDDRRSRYENFRGKRFRDILKVVERLNRIAAELNKTPSQVALRWVLESPGVNGALFGAKNPNQVQDNLGALGWRLPKELFKDLEEQAAAAEPSIAEAAA